MDEPSTEPPKTEVTPVAPVEPVVAPVSPPKPKKSAKKFIIYGAIGLFAIVLGLCVYQIVSAVTFQSSLKKFKSSENYSKLSSNLGKFKDDPKLVAFYNCKATPELVLNGESTPYQEPYSNQVTLVMNNVHDAFLKVENKNPVFKPLPLVGLLPPASSAKKSSDETVAYLADAKTYNQMNDVTAYCVWDLYYNLTAFTYLKTWSQPGWTTNESLGNLQQRAAFVVEKQKYADEAKPPKSMADVHEMYKTLLRKQKIDLDSLVEAKKKAGAGAVGGTASTSFKANLDALNALIAQTAAAS